MHFSSSYPLIHNMEEPKYKENNIRHQFLKHLTIQYLEVWIMISHIVLFISQLPDIVQKCFCTPDGPMDPTFKMKYLPAF